MTSPGRLRLVVAALAGLGGFGGCGLVEGSRVPPDSPTAVPIGEVVHARLRPILTRIEGLRAAGPRALAETGPLVDDGLALLRARMPHDVARPDVPRWTAARQGFGDALKDVIHARDAGDRAAFDAALSRLEGATRRWSDAHLGLAPESSL